MEVKPMKTVNPFNIAFGKEPLQLIERPNEFARIVDDFDNLNPESNAYVITGARGCGKTILLSSIRSHYENDPGWITVDLVPYKDILELFAATLYQQGNFKKLFMKGEFSFSFHGLSFSIEGEKPVTNVINMLSLMLEHAQKKNMRVLVTIDEVSASEEMKSFAHAFQLFLGKGYPVFLLMTGLPKNVTSLEGEKTLTFLLRAPKIRLGGLDASRIAEVYRDSLGVDEKESIVLAKYTKGYAFAFQVHFHHDDLGIMLTLAEIFHQDHHHEVHRRHVVVVNHNQILAGLHHALLHLHGAAGLRLLLFHRFSLY